MSTTIRYIREGKPVRLVQSVSSTGICRCVQCARPIPKAYREGWNGKHGWFCTDACAIRFAVYVASEAWVKPDPGEGR